MSLKNFLRYGSCHMLFLPGDGAAPQLNPLGWSSHSKSGKPTRRWHEPLWAFRLRQRLFCFAGYHRCPDRGSVAAVFKVPGGDKALPDTWDLGQDGYRTCSFCGSIHPDDFMDICRKTLTDERYAVEPSDKRYKVYVRQPGVKNASMGAIKFYMGHAPAKPTPDDQLTYSQAVKVSNDRYMAKWHPKKTG